MSKIEKIGTALFGDSWMAQTAHSLTNKDGKPLVRQTVQSWHNRDKMPEWAFEQLSVIANKRLAEIHEISLTLKSKEILEFFTRENEQIIRYVRFPRNLKRWYRINLDENTESEITFENEAISKKAVVYTFNYDVCAEFLA